MFYHIHMRSLDIQTVRTPLLR